MEVNVCRSCGRPLLPNARKMLFDGGFEIVFCTSCLVGSTYFPQIGQNSERESTNEQVYKAARRVETYLGRRIEFNRRYEQHYSMLGQGGPVASALDVGCNIGYWLYFLKKKGIPDVVGLEMNKECRKVARDIFELDIRDTLKELDRKFDLISMFDVLEHMENPLEFLKESSAVAHPGTYYLIQLPNYQSRMAKWMGDQWPWWAVPDHLSHFCPDGIATLFERAGLKVIALETCDTMYDLIEHVVPVNVRPFFRPFLYVHRTSGYVFQRASGGGLIQVLAKRD